MRGYRQLVLLLLVATFCMVTETEAATITSVHREHCHLLLKGPIETGDLERLKGAERAAEQARRRALQSQTDGGYGLCLDSPGGSYEEALAIARHVFGASEASTGTSTFVDREEACYSACAIIWLAGTVLYESSINPSRALHVLAKLGFHAPYLTEAPAGTYSGQAVVNAYQAGLAAIGKLADIPYGKEGPYKTRIAKSYTGEIIPHGLLAEMLRHGPNEMFLVDTLAKVLLWEFRLEGFARPQAVNRQALCNACTNNEMSLRKRMLDASACSDGRVDRTAMGYRGYFQGFGGEGTYTCVVDVRLEGNRPKELRLELHATGNEQRFKPDELYTRPLWHFYLADDAPLSRLATVRTPVVAGFPPTPEGTTPAPPTPPRPGMWSHNGSMLRLVADGARRRFYYETPRQAIRDEGVANGTLLFDGIRNSDSYSGTAYAFSRRCGATPYAVTGLVSSDQRRVTLYGQAPVRLDQSCRPVGFRDDALVFDFAGTP